MTPKLRYLLGAFLLALPADQLTKLWVSANVPVESFADRITVVDGFFYITHARNPGAAFGLLVDWPWAWRITLFSVVAAIAVFVVLSFFRSLAPGDRFNASALGLIMGGALGNLIDRLTRGEVIDFLHFRLWGNRSWPDFNLADSFLVVGVAALMLELLASEAESRAKPGEAERNEGDA
ncbi:MAG: signal peptidase II [Deltaproteobacteria bacterium]|nr:signal peptidase II [Deltaproteobacteria bacterium]